MKRHELPIGELHVELVRPMMRFGLSLQIYFRDRQGTVYHARPNVDGDLVFNELEPYTYPDSPSLYIDDELAEKLKAALNSETLSSTTGHAQSEHLKDAIRVRDRLLDLVDRVHTPQLWRPHE